MTDTSTREPSTVEVLRQARDLLADDGWCQGHYTTQLRGKVRHCTVGSILIDLPRIIHNVSPERWKHEGAYATLRDALIDLHGCQNLVLWNDEPGRTLPEVLELFDRAIRFAEAAEPHQHNMLCMDDEGRDCCPDPTHVGF